MLEPVSPPQSVVTTIAAKCRRCYNCVRSCPAKAIRVQAGQARVVEERCIGCGNCLRVCARQAKQVQSAVPRVEQLLAGDRPVVAILAPSHPAAYEGIAGGQLIAGLRRLGFAQVMEVSFGAEMVAREYARLFREQPDRPLISTACPALVGYVRKYMPDLVSHLAPVVSPMVAMGRAVKQTLAPGAHVVFIGPCVAKKAEMQEPEVADAVDAALTFLGLQEMLEQRGINLAELEPGHMDGPQPHYGGAFAISGGLIKTAHIAGDIMDDAVVVVEGPRRCLEALEDLREGNVHAHLLDALFCQGCIAGPAYPNALSPLARKERVTAYARETGASAEDVAASLARVADIQVSREITPRDMSLPRPNEREIRDILARIDKLGPEDELNCGACGYRSCHEKAVAVYQGLAEPEMCLPYLIDQMQVNLERLTRSKAEVEKARSVAARARQLASMGRLAADIAHEISNPLSNIIVYAQLLRDSLPEADPQREDIATITAEALHCREIMSGLQHFARQREPQWQQTTVAEVIRRALDELRNDIVFANEEIECDLAEGLPPLVADPGQLARAVVNVLINSLEATAESGTVRIESRLAADQEHADIVISDTGPGIEPDLLERVFEPFVTTKDARRGAGLGLPVAHGIVEAHGGEIGIESPTGEGTRVTMHLPLDIAPAPPRESAKILVVDDDPDFLQQEQIMLEGMGYDVVTAERSDEALEVAERDIPDAFVLDLMMERTDSGARLARRLRRDPRFRHAPIIMLTSVVSEVGFEFRRNPAEVLEWLKADAWFDKPAPMAELGNTLQRLLEGRDEAPEEVSS